MNKVYAIILMILCISGCTGERCIDADDFGFANFVVSSRYDKSELMGQIAGHQVAPWKYSNFRVNGRPLAILVRGWTFGEDENWPWELSAWCGWFGHENDDHTLSDICYRLQDCQFIDGIMCTNTTDAQIINAPCLFRNGVGLYALIASSGKDPNTSVTSMLSPDGLDFHLGEPTVGYEMLEVTKYGKTRKAGGLVYKYEEGGKDQATLKRTYADSKLYFKILDKYYVDNSGHYKIAIKSGIFDVSPDPISYVTNLVKNFLFGTDGDDFGLIRKLYLGITSNPGYRAAVAALLTLYIVFTVLEYLTGNINVTHTELIIRIAKIAIISTLLSAEHSWTFFNDYLFAYFIGGVEQIIQMIIAAGASGPGSSGIIGLMLAPQTMSKLFSLLFVDWLGFIYIILFFIALFFILIVFFQAAVIYLTALLAIGLIITMGPIFICFLLFGVTRSLFENWLKQLISYAIQPIILFTGLVFISMILRAEIYGALGFRVCKFGFPKILSSYDSDIAQINREAVHILTGGSETVTTFFDGSLFYWWFPNPMKGERFTRETSMIPIPIDHFDSNGELCEAYGCVGARYPDLPFLDPIEDHRRLNNFWNGKFVQLDGMLLIFVAIYLLHKFNGLSVSTAKFIAGTSGSLADIQKAGSASYSGIKSNFNNYVGSPIKDRLANTTAGRAITGTIRDVKAKAKYIEETPSRLVDNARVASLKKDALGSGANSAVLGEVKKNTGLEQKDLKPNAIPEYKNEIANRIKRNNPDLSEAKADKIASELSKGSNTDMDKRLAQLQYDKPFEELNDTQKQHIKNTLEDKYKGKSMQELSNDAMMSRRFQEAYVDAYQNLSERGVGLFGKNIAPLRSVEEINYTVKEQKQENRMKRYQKGEEMYSGYEGLKSSFYEKATGNKGSRSEFGNNVFGGSYHQIDQNTPRKQTYAESMADQKQALNHQKIHRQIRQLNNQYRDNVTSPEYQAKHTSPAIEQLTRAEIKQNVYESMTSGKDPALMGDKYNKEFAKDSELRHQIDKSYQVERDIMKNDEFVNRQEHYESRLSIASKNIEDKHDLLTNHYKRDVSAQEMPALLEDYYGKNPSLNKADTSRDISNLKKDINDFDQSQLVLQKIDERKKMISDEVETYVSKMNQYRENAKMEQYKPAKEPTQIRKLRTIDEHLKNR
jgi:type IV secretion system protein VirB6